MKDILVGLAAAAVVVCAVLYISQHVSAGCADLYFFKTCAVTAK